ncbi:acyl-CoA N-acyltransferase [Whalleya microplaca]|nr:acyl-CoA N-acyltransferase [Whalleya microplaca]
MSSPPPPPKRKVKTTLPTRPLRPSPTRPTIQTPRLLIRPFSPSDITGIHALRQQPEVMRYARTGRPDRDHADTRAYMAAALPPRDADTFNHVIALRATGEIIGTGGVIVHEGRGWPELGYLFRREAWGHGYATEFVRALLGAWWALPREGVEGVEVEVEGGAGEVVEEGRGPGEGEGEGGEVLEEVEERVYAMVEATNLGSCRVLEKVGFREFHRWVEIDGREGRVGNVVPIVGFVLAEADQKD